MTAELIEEFSPLNRIEKLIPNEFRLGSKEVLVSARDNLIICKFYFFSAQVSFYGEARNILRNAEIIAEANSSQDQPITIEMQTAVNYSLLTAKIRSKIPCDPYDTAIADLSSYVRAFTHWLQIENHQNWIQLQFKF
jgi:hypothetical protein